LETYNYQNFFPTAKSNMNWISLLIYHLIILKKCEKKRNIYYLYYTMQKKFKIPQSESTMNKPNVKTQNGKWSLNIAIDKKNLNNSPLSLTTLFNCSFILPLLQAQ
jgi:hypothetical protein